MMRIERYRPPPLRDELLELVACAAWFFLGVLLMRGCR